MTAMTARKAYIEISKHITLPSYHDELTIKLSSGKNVLVNGKDSSTTSEELWKLLPFKLPENVLEVTIFLKKEAAAVFDFTCYLEMKE